jgi:crossover junction endodeoxyribonuclease RuvC
MRVIGIDCGTERTGFGVIESDGRDHRLVVYGTIRTSPRDPLPARLAEIARALRDAILIHRPDSAAIEDVFFAANAKSALKLAHVRGVAMLAVEEARLPLGEYSPLTIKTSVAGFGRAEKEQVKRMVRSLLCLDADVESLDASDALAVAICHATRQ